MEALVILLAEFLFAPIIAGIIAFGNVVISIILTIIEIICLCLGLNSKRDKKEGEKKEDISSKDESFPPVKKADVVNKTTGLKFLKRVSFVLLIVCFGSLLAINFLFLNQVSQWFISKIEKKTGIELNVGKVAGNIFTGSLNLTDVRTSRVSEQKSSFNFSVQKVSINIDVPSLIFRPIKIESLYLDNVSGKIVQPDVSEEKNKDISHKKADKIKSGRSFVVDDLNLSNINILISKGDSPPVDFNLKKIESSPFRSNYAIFDVFFRSNILGSINGNEIIISTEVIDSGRITKWNINELPVSVISSFVKKPPIGWFEGGTIDIKVEDNWQLNDAADINMDWSLRLRDVTLRDEPKAGIIEKAVSKYIKSKDGNVDLGFVLVMNQNQFENVASIDASGIWDSLVKSVSKNISLKSDYSKEDVKQGIDNAVDGFKGFLQKRRSKETESQ